MNGWVVENYIDDKAPPSIAGAGTEAELCNISSALAYHYLCHRKAAKSLKIWRGDIWWSPGNKWERIKFHEQAYSRYARNISISVLRLTTVFIALKGFNPKSATFRQHYYPEGGWGWVIIICATVVQILTSGIQLSFGILYIHCLKMFGQESVMSTGNFLFLTPFYYIFVFLAWVGVTCLALSYGITPGLVAFCR